MSLTDEIIKILKANEGYLSDGFEFYAHNSGYEKTEDDVLQEIAREIEKLFMKSESRT